MSEERVKIISKIKGTVVIYDRDIPIRREWTRKGQVQTIPMDIMQDLIYQEGVLSLFEQGVLYIEDKDARVKLGLEVEGEEPTIKMLTDTQMLGALYGKTEDLKKTLEELPKAQIDELVGLAVEKEITDMAKVDVIEKFTGKNIIKLVQYNRQLKEEPKTED